MNKYCNLDGTQTISSEYTKINDGFALVGTDKLDQDARMQAHVDGGAEKHPAEDITYTGAETGTNVKDAIDNLKADVTNLSFTGSSHDALVTAALVDEEGQDFGETGAATYLNGRLNKWELRTIMLEAGVNVKKYGAKGDGVTNDTTAIQNALNDGAANKKAVYFPSGTYITGQITIPDGNLEVFGDGWNATFIMPLAANQTLFYKEQSAVGGTDNVTNNRKTFRNMAFADENGLGGCRAIYCQDIQGFHLENILFRKLDKAVEFNRGQNISLNNIKYYKGGRFIFDASPYRAYGATYDYCKTININNVVDLLGYSDLGGNPWWTFRDCVNIQMSNVQSPALMGTAIGISVEGNTEGFWANNVIIVWSTVGIRIIQNLIDIGSGTPDTYIAPQYTNLIGVAVDQPSLSAFIIEGQYTNMESCIAANGVLRGTGQGIELHAQTQYFNAAKLLIRDMASNGIGINSGACDIVVRDSDIYNNATTIGAQINAVLTKPFDAVFRDCRIVGTISITGSRVINGSTSNIIYKNNNSVQTDATTNAIDLMSYTIPAGTLKVGQKVALKAFGTLAANTDSKTLRIFFGSSSIGGFVTTVSAATWWMITAEITLNAVGSQEYYRTGILNGVNPSVGIGTLTTDESADIIVKVQGQNGTASAGDIVCEGFSVEVIS